MCLVWQIINGYMQRDICAWLRLEHTIIREHLLEHEADWL